MMIKLTNSYGDKYYLQSRFIELIYINEDHITEIRMYNHPGVAFVCKETPEQVANLVDSADEKK